MKTPDAPRGVWAAQPIPWSDDEEFDPGRYQSDVEYLCAQGVHGVYSGGTTGEFYTLDFNEFQATNTVMLRTAARYKVPVQVGVTALCTREVVRRTRWAADHGAAGVQVALPFWLALKDDEVLNFFRDVGAAAGESYIIHYDTMRSKRTIGPDLYLAIRREVPHLLGSKLADDRVESLAECRRVLLDFTLFVGESALQAGMAHGARGTYSSLVMTNPKRILELYSACAEGREKQAQGITERIQRFSKFLQPYRDKGYLDSAIDRMKAMLNPNMKCGLRCRKPYKFFSPAELNEIRAWLEENDSELLTR